MTHTDILADVQGIELDSEKMFPGPAVDDEKTTDEERETSAASNDNYGVDRVY